MRIRHILAVIAFCGVWNAQAAVLTQTQDIDFLLSATITASAAIPSPSVKASFNKTLLFNEFDPSLGTLDKVEVNLTAAAVTTGSFSLIPEGQLTSADFKFSNTETFAFGPLPGSFFSVSATFAPAFPFSVGITSSESQTVTFTLTTPTNLSFSISGQNNTMSFLGTNTFGMDVSLSEEATLALLQGFQATASITTKWDPPGDSDGITVTYTYTPVPTAGQVSEPNSLAMMLVALVAALGFTRRRVS